MRNNNIFRFYKSYWFLFWILIYSLLYYLSSLFLDLLNIVNNTTKLIFIAIIFSLFSRIITVIIYKNKFRFNFYLFIWTLVYVIILLSVNYLLLKVSFNFFIIILLNSLILTLVIHLLKKIRFKQLKNIVIIIILIYIIMNLLFNFVINRCEDGTLYNNCSNIKPYFCQKGNLIEFPEKCLCDIDEIYTNGECLHKLQTEPKPIKLNYTLRGVPNSFNYTVYNGFNYYLSNLPRTVTYSSYESPPTSEYMLLRFVNTENQERYILPLINEIKKITTNNDDQARIAISLVQTMPYDWDSFNNNYDNRYAYETLYDQTGVCGDKTNLLALMLKELGYGVAIFSFELEQHASIGLKCPIKYSYNNSGYCFIETTTPSIITDSDGDYIGVGKLISKPNIYVVSEGKSFESVKEEYDDNLRLKFLQNKLDSYGSGQVLDEFEYNEWKKYHDEWQKLTEKYGFRYD